jgi:pre-mRNA-splicing helicase BRR2
VGSGLAAGQDDEDAAAAAESDEVSVRMCCFGPPVTATKLCRGTYLHVQVARGLVPVHRIDAYWLQRELSKYFDDATVAQAHADSALAILGSGMEGGGSSEKRADMREVETRLVGLLGYDKFDVVKLLLRNAARVYYVTRLKQAQTDAERAAVRRSMALDIGLGGPAVLAALERTLTTDAWAQDRTQAKSEQVRREAKGLAAAAASSAAGGPTDIEALDVTTFSTSAPASAGGAGAVRGSSSAGNAVPERSLDLDALAFSSGAHLMSNKRVELPKNSWRSQKKGYEEVHVPALKAKPYSESERDLPIEDMPDWAQPAFKGMKALNRVQVRRSISSVMCAIAGEV